MKVIFILSLFLIFSCSRKTLHLNNVRHAAVLTIPADLDTLVIVNRDKIAKGGGKQVLSVLEGVLSGEPILGDKYGTASSVDNMKRLIERSDRLSLATTEILKFERKDLEGNRALDGDIVDSICNHYNADGVISLELFDSDSYYANNSATVRSLWRLYYAEKREISDEHSVHTNGTGYHGYHSIVPPQYNAIASAGAHGAQLYYDRIVPYFRRELRHYYGKGSAEFKLAQRAVRVNDWDQAIFFWQSYLENSSHMKKNGRAAYNLALAYEVNEDFQSALEWIDQSIKYGEKHAIEYKATLKWRMQEQPLIEEQLRRE